MHSTIDAGFFEQLSRSEADYARRLRELADKLRHPVVKALVLGVALESEKHSFYYKALAELARGSPVLSEDDLDLLRRELAKHVEEERKDYEELKGLLEGVRDLDVRVRLLLESILEDEKRHHALFKAVYERIAELESVSEQEFWDSVWRDAVYHGAPGG
jgi:rubrerythrin